MKKKKRKNKVSIKEIEAVLGLGHLCLIITLIMLVWVNLMPFLSELNIYLKTLFLLITGIGACMIYMFMGFMLQDLKMVVFEEEYKNEKKKRKTKKR